MASIDRRVGKAHRDPLGSANATGMSSARPSQPSLTPRRLGALLLAVVVVAAAGCKGTFDNIIGVDPADRVSESALFDNPAQAELLTASARAQFECALGTYALATGLLVNELNTLGSTQMFSLDSHQPDGAGGLAGQYGTGDCNADGGSVGVYVPLSSARWFADRVLEALEGWGDAEVPNRAVLIATVAAYSGFAHTLLGEGFCSMALDGGAELTPAQMFALAETKFTGAITAASGADAADIVNMATVGRARVRLNQGKTAEALVDALAVPPGYVKNATRGPGSTLRENQLYTNTVRDATAGLGPNYLDVRFNGVPDPRVPAVFLGPLTAGVLRYSQSKYASESSPIPIATGAEAQLIAAEIQGGQAAADVINELHAAVGLDPFSSSDPTEIRNHLVEERRRQFFLDGHRVWDKIRLDLPLDPAPGTPYRWGGVHGSAKCLPLPDIERDNNGNFPH